MEVRKTVPAISPKIQAVPMSGQMIRSRKITPIPENTPARRHHSLANRFHAIHQ